MSELRPIDQYPVDRSEETVVTQQPGYVATEQIVHDRAAERRLVFMQIVGVLWTILGILEILFGLRFVLKLIAANPSSGFAEFIYGTSGLFLSPFAGLTANPTSGTVILEVTTLIGMAVYLLFFWIVVRLIALAASQPSARTVTRSVHEQTAPQATHAESTGANHGSSVETQRTVHTVTH